MRPARLGRNLEIIGWLLFLCGSLILGLFVLFGLKHQQALTERFDQAMHSLFDARDEVRRAKNSSPVSNQQLEELEQAAAEYLEKVNVQHDYTLRLQATSLLLIFAGMASKVVGMIVRKNSKEPGELKHATVDTGI